MGTFRLAGIESQTVFKILEAFGSVFYGKLEEANVDIFADKTECYEFAYLLIVLQTCQHNKAIKQKSTLKLFESQAKEMVPKTCEKGFPDGFLQTMFERITALEITAPVAKDVRKCDFNLEHFTEEIRHRLSVKEQTTISNQSGLMMTDDQFFSTSDLSKPQLFNYHNKL